MITIKETRQCDTRAKGFNAEELTEEIVEKETKDHIAAVRKTMAFLAEAMLEQSKEHDHTKLGKHLSAFTKELANNFETEEWYKMHCETERHHLLKHVPKDVNLIDVLEMVADGVCAGLARNGSCYDIEIPEEVLLKAVKNTQELLIKNIKVIK